MPDSYTDELAPVIQTLAALIRRHRAADLEASPHLIDRVVTEVLRDVGRGTAERLFEVAADSAVDDAQVRARKEGYALFIERSPKITFTSVFGPISIKSPYLRPPGPAAKRPPSEAFLFDTPPGGVRPVNDALRVRGGGLTVQLERVLVDFGLDGSFEDAAAKAKEHYGLDIHRTTVRRTVLRHGDAAETARAIAALQLDSRSRRDATAGPPLLVEMDGSSVRTGTLTRAASDKRTPKRGLPIGKRTTEWRDLRLGFVRPLEGDAPVFVGGIVPLDEVARRLRDEAVGFKWTPNTVAVRVTDGGHGVREALDRVFPTGVHVLDRPHLVHHLHETAEARGLAKEAAAAVVGEWNARIGRGEVDQVIPELLAYKGKGDERSTQLAHYLQRFRDAVHYDEFKRCGYPVGSGEIESAHKGKVQTRMKLPGTWWTEGNANRLLALRLLRANGRWDAHWRRAA